MHILPKLPCPQCQLLVATTAASNFTQIRKHTCRAGALFTRGTNALPIMPGQHFGQWVVLRENNVRQHRQVMYDVRCSCGFEAIVPGRSLNRGTSKSCRSCSKARAGDVRATLHKDAKEAGASFQEDLDRLLNLHAIRQDNPVAAEWYQETYQKFCKRWQPVYAPKPEGFKKKEPKGSYPAEWLCGD